MKLEKTIEIKAPRAKVWAALVAVQNWPLWTESITRIERLDDGPFGMGSQVRITQPKLLVLVWQVMEFEPGASFAWRATSRGVTTLASPPGRRDGRQPVDGDARDQADGADGVGGGPRAGRGDAPIGRHGGGGPQAVLRDGVAVSGCQRRNGLTDMPVRGSPPTLFAETHRSIAR